MISDKARRLLKKIQALSDNLNDQGSVSSLERDLLLSYLRDLYDELSNATPNAQPRQAKFEEQKATISHPPVVEERPAEHKPVAPPPPPSPPPPPAVKVEEEPVRVHTVSTPAETTPPPRVQTAEPVYYYPPAADAQQAQPAAATKMTTTGVLTALFEFRETAELSEKLKLQPIDRIEHGMGINERMLAINELFNGDNELFKKTLDHLNALGSFQDAQTYLTEGVATQCEWGSDTRKGKATYFIQLVRRRYVTR